ncbi:hypothetical protein [Nocardioides currus]|uniref:Flavin reductase like domain-containing protein n=1 Tax=Nocardioides currus TaxID=2133958 RepID=A0A2R7YXI1_9ACTN|nr:hypothetical protein [Nocardioides currus]PUA81098.1 hypothetical protein C7S10_12060 [Nocardioides currus]
MAMNENTPATPPEIDPRRFREVLGHYPTGVCIVTAIAPTGEPTTEPRGVVGFEVILGAYTSLLSMAATESVSLVS